MKLFEIGQIFQASAGAFIASQIVKPDHGNDDSVHFGKVASGIAFLKLHAGNRREDYEAQRGNAHSDNLVRLLKHLLSSGAKSEIAKNGRRLGSVLRVASDPNVHIAG